MTFDHNYGKCRPNFSERRPFVCRLSVCLSVMFLHPTQLVEIFGNVSSLLGTLAIH